jgi:glucokinase
VQGREGVRQVSAVVALDIGGTHVTAARVEPDSASAEPLVRVDYAPHADRTVLLGGIVGAAASVAGPAADAVGVAAPGPFDYEHGICTIRGLGKLEALYGVDLRRELARALRVRPEAVVFLNDAEAFLLGESAHGAARGQARAIGLTLGTGLGSAFLVDGAIVRAGPGVPPDGSLHLLPFRDEPVEERISARGLRARMDRGRLDVRELAQGARAGRAGARQAFAAFAADLAEFLQPTVHDFEPTCLVVGGAIARAWDLIGDEVTAAFPSVDVARAVRIDEAALLGAALHALSTSARP